MNGRTSASTGRWTPGARAGLAAILLGVGVRAALLWPALDRPLEDIDSYLAIAQSLANGEGYRLAGRLTAYRPPLYPVLLAPLVARFGQGTGLARAIFALHVTLGIFTIAATAGAARRWGLSQPSTLAAALIVALDPVLVAQGRLVMTETLAAALVAGSLWALAAPGRIRPMLAGGLALGLAALCRPSLLAAVVLIAIALLVRPGVPRRVRLGQPVLLLTVVAAMLSPWAVRNQRALGHAVWTTTHGGYTLALGNNPVYYDEVIRSRDRTVWSGAGQRAWWDGLGRMVEGGRGEVEIDRRIRDHAVATIRTRPGDFVRASLDRLARLWGIAPSVAVYPRSLRLATAAWTVPLWMALAAGLLKRSTWTWPRSAAPAFLIALTAVHAVYWTDLRMRAPVVPAIALIAAAGLAPLLGRIGSSPRRDLEESL